MNIWHFLALFSRFGMLRKAKSCSPAFTYIGTKETVKRVTEIRVAVGERVGGGDPAVDAVKSPFPARADLTRSLELTGELELLAAGYLRPILNFTPRGKL
jgi:hypothetical protein